jgi:hypothetical protein
MKERIIPMSVFMAMFTLFVGESFLLFGDKDSSRKSAGPKVNTVMPDEKGFEAQARPFLQKYCTRCHGNEKQKNKLNLETLSRDMSKPEAGNTWNDVYAQLQFDEMPPSKSKAQPPASEKDAFLKWLDGELIRFGRGFGLEDKLLLPKNGNYVDHKTLFDGSVTDLPYSPARLWRQRPDIYTSLWQEAYGTTHDIRPMIGRFGHTITRGRHKDKRLAYYWFKPTRYANPFVKHVYHASGFTDYSDIVADQASLEALLANAEAMAEALTRGVKSTVTTLVRSKNSGYGGNNGGFVGGLEEKSIAYIGRIPVIFKKIRDAEAAISRDDFNEALNAAFALLLNRRPEQAEYAEHYGEVYQKNEPLGNEMALQAVLIYITLSPEFVYRMELGMGEKDAHGRRMLSSQELVYAIHHAFYDSQPYAVGELATVDANTKRNMTEDARTNTIYDTPENRWAPLRAKGSWVSEQMTAGKLKTRADVEVVVRKLVSAKQTNLNPTLGWPSHWGTDSYKRGTNPRILNFFREFFGYHTGHTVFKDNIGFGKKDGFKHFVKPQTGRAYTLDTDSLILHILEEDENVLYELLTTTRIYTRRFHGKVDEGNVKRWGKEEYLQRNHLTGYNLNPFEHLYSGGPARALHAPKEQRCGILTQVSWLLSHSGNFDNDPVRRGKWIREKLLAGVVMDVPVTVDAKVPDDPHKTLRERFSVVEEGECWRCHKKMNPLGMPFEAYNHVGKWRATEKGKPVNTTGAIKYTGDKTMEGEVKNVREMMEKIAKSDLARQSFIRHVFRYWMGRNEMLSDSKSMIAMDKAYVTSGGSFKELLVSLLTSDSFLYRK